MNGHRQPGTSTVIFHEARQGHRLLDQFPHLGEDILTTLRQWRMTEWLLNLFTYLEAVFSGIIYLGLVAQR